MADNRDQSPLGQLAQRRTALAAYPTSVRDGSSPGAAGDPLRRLQAAARSAGDYVARVAAARVVVLDDSGCVLLDVLVPPGSPGEDEPGPVAPGWQVTDRRAHYDGQSVPVAPSRRKLLRVLVDANEALTAKELTARVFDQHTDESNTRYHIRELKKELAKAFPEFEESAIVGDNDGYRLVLR